MKRTAVLIGALALVVTAMAGPALAQSYVAGLTVEKAVEGDAPAGAEFDFSLTCDIDGYSQDFTLADSDAETFEDVPQGAECTLTESVPDDADFGEDDFVTSYEIDGEETSGLSVTFTIPDADGASVLVNATNDFGDTGVAGAGELVVSKRVDGDDDGEWEFRVDCGTVRDTVTLGDGDSETFTITRAPDTTCTITELDAGRYDVTHSIDGDEAQDGVRASFTFDDESVPLDELLVREVEFTNTPEGEDETGVLADTGLELSWGVLLAAGLLLPGAGVLLYARTRDRRDA